jgi:sigma-B regulation protein RsbU (phosphoserine phosphatase)
MDDDHLCIVMADVAGKGVPAALFMVNAMKTIRARASYGGTPSEIFFDVNNILFKGNKEKIFVTVWMAVLDLNTGEVIESNAGHENPAVRGPDGDFS